MVICRGFRGGEGEGRVRGSGTRVTGGGRRALLARRLTARERDVKELVLPHGETERGEGSIVGIDNISTKKFG